MNYKYVVYGDGKVWKFHLNKIEAYKTMRELIAKGVKQVGYSEIKKGAN